MAEERNMIQILGCGPGSPDFLTPAVLRGVAECDVLIGAQRLLALFQGAPAEKIPATGTEHALQLVQDARDAGRRVAVLVSGDPGVCSLARLVIARFGLAACHIVPGISSVQVAFARLGLEWHDARIISIHGGMPNAEPDDLRMTAKIAVLTGHPASAEWIQRLLSTVRMTHRAFWCVSLSLPDERVEEIAAPSNWRVPEHVNGILVLIRGDVFEGTNPEGER